MVVPRAVVLKFNSAQMLSQPQISDRHKHIFTSRNPNNQRETWGLFLDGTSTFREGASADSHLIQDYADVFVYRIWGRKKNPTDQQFSCLRDDIVHPKLTTLSIFTRPSTILSVFSKTQEIFSLRSLYDYKRLRVWLLWTVLLTLIIILSQYMEGSLNI